MKQKIIKLTTTALLSSVLTVGVVSLLQKKNSTKVTNAASLPTTIYLKDNTDAEIKNYYSSLSSLPESELSGTNLLKNLKGIISNVSQYYSYGSNVPNIYVITDRDWTNSPTLSSGTYNASTKTVTNFSHNSEVSSNPYIHMLYHDYTNAGMSKTHYTGDGDVSASSKSFDNEHVWSQSHGFYSGSGNPLEGAGTDLHHLIAGTQYGNRTLHNNYSYGFVKQNDSDWAATISNHSKPYEEKNKRGEPLFAHSQDQENKVFEPQDCDKGDIARAMLYMAACYNNLDGSTPTPALPALNIMNYVIGDTTGYSSDDITKGYYGVLQDLLAWHAMDPVDEYEIHRNNLIYNNYQHNRNPFIDYPQWVDYIWGTSIYDENTKTIDYDSTSTGSVDLDADKINGYRSLDPIALEVTTQPTKNEYYIDESLDTAGLVVTATFEARPYERNVTNKCTFEYDFSTPGNKTVTVKYGGLSTSFNVTVQNIDLVRIDITNFPIKTEYQVGETFDTTGLSVTATYSNGHTADVTDNCTYEYDFSSAGNKEVTIRCGEKTTSLFVTVKAAPKPDEPTNKTDMKTILIYVAIGVGAVILIVLIATGIVKVNKKGKVKVSKSGVKKVVKKTTKKKKK